METIYKYHIPIDRETVLEIPGGGGKVLLLDTQGIGLYAWMEVNTEQPRSTRTFRIVGTGHDLATVQGMVHVGSVQQKGFVWHVYSDRR